MSLALQAPSAETIFGAETSPSQPVMRADRGVYSIRIRDYLLLIDRLEHKGLDAHAELAAYVVHAQGRREFARFTVNLLSLRARNEQAKYLKDQARDDRVVWADVLSDAFRFVIHTEREGAPAVELATLPAPAVCDEPTYSVSGITLPMDHQANLFGGQGSGKTWVGLHVACTLAELGVPTLIIDNEMSESANLKRVHLLTGGAVPRRIFYTRSHLAIVHDVDRLRRLVTDHRIGYYVIDSLGPAVSGSPNDAENATAALRSLRQLEIGGLVIGHVARAAAESKSGGPVEPDGPFGSVFFGNLARQNWLIRREEADGSGSIRAGLISKKSTFGADLSPVGIEIRFERDEAGHTSRVHVVQVDAADVAPSACRLPIWQRMRAELLRGRQTPHALAETLGEKVDTISRTARRLKMFRVIPGGGGVPGTIGMSDDRGNE